MVKAWRIFKPQHAADAFTGAGARLFGGRWNSTGVAIVYTAGSRSLAALEMLVHLQSRELLERYVVCEVSFDRRWVRRAVLRGLPRDWRERPPSPKAQHIGDAWVRSGRSAVLEVPSAVIAGEWNYLLNPNHADFAKIRIARPRRFGFDARLKSG